MVLKTWKRGCIKLKIFLIFMTVLIQGCQTSEAELPLYEMTEGQDCDYLYIDNVEYRKEAYSGDRKERELVSDSGGDLWIFSDGIGEQIGTYKDGSRKYEVYSIKGDTDKNILYSQISGFHTGPMDGGVWLREGVSLGSPKTEDIAEILITDKNEEVLQKITDTDRIFELLDAYENGDGMVKPDEAEDWKSYTLTLIHKEYSFLKYEITGFYSPSLKIAGCYTAYSEGREARELPSEWADIFMTAG